MQLTHFPCIRFFVFIAMVCACWMIAAPAHTQSHSRTVAEVGGQEVTVDDLAEYVESRAYLYRYRERARAYRHALDDLITDELKRIDFFESGLALNDTLVRDLQRVMTEELQLVYVKHRYEDRYLTEGMIRDEYENMGRVVFYRRLVLKKPANASQAILDSLRATVEGIREQIDAGAPFEELVHRYSDEATPTGRSGAATPVTWKQTLRNPHAFILFQLSPGDVRTFEGSKSFSIERVERVDQIPVPALHEVREEIVQALHGRYAAEATRAYRNEWDALVDSTSLRWNPAALEQVVAWANTPGFFENGYHSAVSGHLSRDGDSEILSDRLGDVRLSELPELIDEVLTLLPSGRHSTADVKEYLLEAVRTERLADRARELGLEGEIWRADTPSPVLAQEFVRIYNERNIEQRIPEATEAALRSFYESVDDSLFYQHPRINTQIIVRSDRDEIEALLEQVKNGIPFEDVSSRRLIRSFQRTADGEIVTLYTREPPYLGEVAFGLQEGDVAGPVSYVDAEEGRQFAIVLATRRYEERQLSFDEVRKQVAEVFADYHRARLAADVAEDLRARYRVNVHRHVLEQLVGDSL